MDAPRLPRPPEDAPTPMTDLKPYIQKVATGAELSEEEAAQAFNVIMSGEATPSQIGGFLMALRVRGETVAEIAGAASVMRAKVSRVTAPAGAVDIVGTGGDGSGSYNVSTCSAFVLAGCGVPVAKHGNRALSSKSGAADVLGALGVNIDLPPLLIGHCIAEAKVGFMFAPSHHPAMKNVGPTRVELGTRTIFNLLGPISNPAGVRRLLIGVFSEQWVEKIAQVMARLGAEHVWVVHGSDGLDEITTTGATFVAEAKGGTVRTFNVSPADVGLPLARPQDLKGGDAATNAAALRGVLDGKSGPYRDIVLMNAGAGLIVAGKASSLAEGVAMATRSIDSGAARERLAQLIALSKGARGHG
jgi:anthranilate phosphoribosyltransferase